MLGKGQTNDVQFLIWSCSILAFQKSLISSHDTMKTFTTILSWNFKWLFLGRWPTHDYNGDEYPETSKAYKLATETYFLAEGFAGVLFANNADLDCFHKTWRLENHTNTENPCIWCRASLDSACNWRDFRPGASWLSAVYTTDSWKAAHPDHLAIFDLLGVTIATFNPDYMHCKYLGLDQYLYGSVLKVLTFHTLVGDPVANMERVMTELSRYFKAHRVPNAYTLITINMFNNKDQPKLKGRAAELRHLGEALLHVFEKFMITAPEAPVEVRTLHKRILITLKKNVELERLLDQETGWNFKGESYSKFVKVAHEMLCGYNACQGSAARLALEMFNVTVKAHHVLHCVHRSKWIHPKAVWCFQGEAFMKVSKALHKSCTNSMVPHKATIKAAHKFMTAIHLQFTGASKP